MGQFGLLCLCSGLLYELLGFFLISLLLRLEPCSLCLLALCGLTSRLRLLRSFLLGTFGLQLTLLGFRFLPLLLSESRLTSLFFLLSPFGLLLTLALGLSRGLLGGKLLCLSLLFTLGLLILLPFETLFLSGLLRLFLVGEGLLFGTFFLLLSGKLGSLLLLLCSQLLPLLVLASRWLGLFGLSFLALFLAQFGL